MVGAGTVIADNPRLTCRIEGRARSGASDHRRALALSARGDCLRQRSTAPTILVTTAAEYARARAAALYGQASRGDWGTEGGRGRSVVGGADARVRRSRMGEDPDRGRGASGRPRRSRRGSSIGWLFHMLRE